MDEFIKRETAIKRVMETKWESGSDGAAAMEIVAATPAADVAPVVRCKDCKHHYDCGVHFCNRLGMDCPDDSDFFCSYGEPKNGGDKR